MASNDNDSAHGTVCGTFSATPLAALLAQAAERKLTGVLSLLQPGEGRRAEVAFYGGMITRIDSLEAAREAGFLGTILYERAIIDATIFDKTLADVARTKTLHGQLLLAAGAITQAQLDDALLEQSHRRMDALFAWPASTVFALREREMPPPGEGTARDAKRPPLDTWRVLWRGTRAHPPLEDIERTIGKLDGELHLTDAGSAARLGLDADEKGFCVLLAQGPLSAATAITKSKAGNLGEARVRALLYCMVIARAVVSRAARVIGPADLGVEGTRERAETIIGDDPWTILGVPRDANADAIRASYFRLARVWHPDKMPKNMTEARDAGAKIFSAISDAHRALQDRLLAGSRPSLPKAPPPTLKDAEAALARGDRVKAVEIAAQLSRAGVHGPPARALLAWCDAEMNGNVERAIASLDRVLHGDPDCLRAVYYRAKLHERARSYDLALADLRRVIRLDPRHLDAQRDLRQLAIKAARSGSSTKMRIVEEVVPFQGRVASR